MSLEKAREILNFEFSILNYPSQFHGIRLRCN